MMKRTLVGGMVIVTLLGILIPECGAEDNAWHKLGRGFKNIVLAPVEIPAGIVTYSKKYNPFITLFIGPLYGVGNGLTRAAAGVAEIISFPLPPYDQPFYDQELGQSLWEGEI